MAAPERHFDESTVAWALVGAVVGVVGVAVITAVAILLTDGGTDLIGVAALGAAFGGTGFGAMLGAVLGSLRQPIVQTVPARDRAADGA